jgi:N utilization substance protein B
MLFQLDVTGASPGDVFQDFWQGQHAAPAEREFAQQLVLGVRGGLAELDRRIGEAAEHWRIERMAVVDRNVLRLAAYELLHCRDIPPKVAINEAIELGKRYSTQNSGAFINGILDKIKSRFADLQKEAAKKGDDGAAAAS